MDPAASLQALEHKRKQLWAQLEALGDFCRGGISVNYRKCGKANCRCARPDHPGHGPQYLWNATIGGQSRARNLHLGPELQKVGREVDAYRRFVELCQELVEVTEQICDLRPVEEPEEEALDQLKKNCAGSTRRSRGGDRALGGPHAPGMAKARRTRFGGGRVGGSRDDAASGRALAGEAPGGRRGGYQGIRIDCGRGHEAQFEGYRDKQLLTVLGALQVRRAYYHCPNCGSGVVPKDGDLDMASTSFSPGVRRMMGRVGAKEPFEEGQRDLEELAGVAVSTKAVERVSEGIGSEVEGLWKREREQAFSEKIVPFASPPAPTMYVAMDGTGVPVLPSEVEGRRGKEGGQAKTREAKLGCVFSQTRRDEQGFPLRDPESTTYVGAIEEATAFGVRIYTEAARRGATRALRLVVLGDGAPWIWGIAAEHFHQAIQIVDLYHARQRLCDLSKIVWGLDSAETQQWVRLHQELLDRGDIEALLDAMRQLPAGDKTARKARRTSIEYFRKNAERMRYACFRSQGLFVGSGVIEAGCKTIIGQRLKQSGMRWTVRGANAIIALRCCQLSNRWEEFWEARSVG